MSAQPRRTSYDVGSFSWDIVRCPTVIRVDKSNNNYDSCNDNDSDGDGIDIDNDNGKW